MEKPIALQNFADKFNLEAKTISYNDKRKADKYILMQNGTKISPEMTYNESNMFLLGYNRGYEQKNCIIEKI
jgi:hypothetical protein